MKDWVKKPVCPICGKEMDVVKYVGYYEKFNYWECKCSDDTLGEYSKTAWRGAYA